MKTKYLSIAFLILLAAVAFFQPRFVECEAVSDKAEVIVLFMGPEWEARKAEALRLARAGHADWIMVPAYGQMFKVTDEMTRDLMRGYEPLVKVSSTRARREYPCFMEDTHFELLQARQLMSEMGFTSALLVSSRYHMQRIRLMAEMVFKAGDSQFLCIPAQGLERYELGNRISELGKLAWFYVYYPFWASQIAKI